MESNVVEAAPVLTIKLSDLMKSDRQIVSGRDVGQNFREKLGGDEIFDKYEQFMIIIPVATRIVSPSLFLGLFGKNLRKMGSINEILDRVSLENAGQKTEANFMAAARTSLVQSL